MTTFRDIFEHIPGGKILDVAMGAGRFVQTFQESLASHTEILGIDNSERAEAAFKQAFMVTVVVATHNTFLGN